MYIVRFREGTPASERSAIVQGAGAVLRINFSLTNAASVEVPNDAALAGLRNNPLVTGVFLSQLFRLDQGRGNGGGGSGGGGSGGGGGGGGGKLKAPSGLAATALSSTQIDLAWSANSKNSGDGFEIERCADANCNSSTQIGTVGNSTTSFSDSGLSAVTTYWYRLRAYDSTGNYSAYSNTAEATTLPDEPEVPPAAPSNLLPTAVSSSQINLTWSDNSGNEDNFYIEQCQGFMESCVSFVQIAAVAANSTSYSNTGLAPDTPYTYRVRAHSNTSGDSAYSNAMDATTMSAGSSQVTPEGVKRIGAAPGRVSVTGAGVGVAIVDTGFSFSHPDLSLAPEEPGVNSFNAFYPGTTCEDTFPAELGGGHGTHVGGTVAARNNAFGVVGVAPDATLYCVKVFDIINDPIFGPVLGATDESLMAGLDWIGTHADQVDPPIRVLNMSLGRPKELADSDPNHPLHLSVKALYDMGISIVVSAGNDALREVSQEIPASYSEVMAVASTTAVDGVNGYDDLFVPCTGEQNILADSASWFTTDGIGVTISAPGESREDIYDYLGGCYLEPIGILSTWPGDAYVEIYGTSMAAPHVTGVVALIWSKELSNGNSSLTPEEIRTRIRNNADRWGTAPLDSPLDEYTYDGEREGVVWAPAAVGDEPAPEPDAQPTVFLNSPANGATFDVGEVISFAGTANDPEDNDLSASLVWTSSRDGQIGTGSSFSRTLTSGTHTITAAVTDSGGNVARESADITIGSSGTPVYVSVTSITYLSQGSDLIVDVALRDEFGAAVSGAVVSVNIFQLFYGYDIWSLVQTTNAQGIARFLIPNAPPDIYSTTVTNVEAVGYTWDGITPSNWSWH